MSRLLWERFHPIPESVAEARHVARRFLSDQPRTVRDSVELGVSELATIAVRHAGTDFDLEVEVVDHRVRVQVSDKQDPVSSDRAESIAGSQGRGLQIVRAISDSFGIDRRPGDGRAIWFEITS